MANYQFAIVLLLSLLVGCSKPLPAGPASSSEFDESFGKTLATWQLEKTQAAVNSTTRLVNATRAALDNPGPLPHETWQTAWLEAHDLWTEAAFLSDRETSSFRQIDAWPIAPGFLDSLHEYPESGIVNDMTLAITSDVIRDQHHFTDDMEATLGLHVIEYYAFSRNPQDFTAAAINFDRRVTLLRLITDLLLLDLLEYARRYRDASGVADPLPRSRAQLLKKMHRRSQEIFSEYNRLGEHSQFSEEHLRNIHIQLKTLRELLQEPMNMNHYLIELHAGKTETLNHTLNDAIALIAGKKTLEEFAATREILLVSSISHQLDDLVRLLPADTDN